ncbi:serine/arginine repetitive matrix protein 2-like [Labeo rohita]|uniref:Serine/arginine repetitive matrix protein 2-like n=1 Tax=Labeo rohita TaxID=84645 RepID=A0A498LQF0_LABRO|nr:serine/arginine repetitive matrix protein 2-like [Labeo rohita]
MVTDELTKIEVKLREQIKTNEGLRMQLAAEEDRYKISMLAMKGGTDTRDGVWRIMTATITNSLARNINMRGVNGKISFKSLQLRNVVLVKLQSERPALPIEGVHIILGNGLVAEELGSEQRSDSSLDVLFQSAVTPAEVGSLARGYVVSDGVLLRKWIPHKGLFADSLSYGEGCDGPVIEP